MQTTIGQLLINEQLPEDLRDADRVLDKGGISKLLSQVAERYPDRYRQIAKDLSDVGRDAAFTTGGNSFGLEALRTSLAAKQLRHDTAKDLQKLYADPKLTEKQREEKLILLTGKRQPKLLEAVLQESRAEDNPLARQLVGAGRGNKFNLNSLRGADLLYTDHRNEIVPIPVLRSYSQGLTPVEYFAGSFGARRGVIDLKSSTSDAGYFAKQLTQIAHRLRVEANDDDSPYDERNPRGLPVATADTDNEGALLAHPAGGYARNTELTPKVLKDLQGQGVARILVRSALVGGAPMGGVYARDVGRRERGALPELGDQVGLTAAQALSNPITQASISSKHSGGVLGATAGGGSGFRRINALVQVPKHFKGGASHSHKDGNVQHIEKAPQGGYYVTIDGEQHHTGADQPLTVKVRDVVEAGDMISEGLPNPAEIVKYKGIGEGRRYFMDAFRQAIEAAGQRGHRRNIELVARGLINHVRLDEELGDFSPDDVLPYQCLERSWIPRGGHVLARPRQAVGQYLEQPTLHYTIGTKIRPSVAKELEAYGVTSVCAHKDAPPFRPEMVRAAANVSQDPDWLTRLLGSYQQKSLLAGARRGAVSDEAGSSYVPALARGVNFGSVLE